MIPDIINYLLSLRYENSDTKRFEPVCFIGGYQLIIPFFLSGQTINLVGKPDRGYYAFLHYTVKFGSDMVPNAFSASGNQYGSDLYAGILTARWLQDEHTFFVFVTNQEPSRASITNISPLAQRYEANGEYLVIPTPESMITVNDALRRIHTSKVAEQLLAKTSDILEQSTGITPSPKPPVTEVS